MWRIKVGQKITKPFSSEKLGQLARNGQITFDTLISRENQLVFVPLSQIFFEIQSEFRAAFEPRSDDQDITIEFEDDHANSNAPMTLVNVEISSDRGMSFDKHEKSPSGFSTSLPPLSPLPERYKNNQVSIWTPRRNAFIATGLVAATSLFIFKFIPLSEKDMPQIPLSAKTVPQIWEITIVGWPPDNCEPCHIQGLTPQGQNQILIPENPTVWVHLKGKVGKFKVTGTYDADHNIHVQFLDPLP